jgi:hypothetical protein
VVCSHKFLYQVFGDISSTSNCNSLCHLADNIGG